MKLLERIGTWRRRRQGACFCAKFGLDGYLPRSWLYQQPDECDCGGDGDVLMLHDIFCDTVPCPFCSRV